MPYIDLEVEVGTMGHSSFWEVLFDNIDEGVYVLDHAGNYIYCNSAFLKMVGASREEALKLNAFRLVPEGQVSKSVGVSCFEQKKRISIINTVVTPKNHRYRQLATATPIFDNMGDITYVLVEMVLLDTLEHRYQKALLSEGEGCVEVYHSFPEEEPGSIIAESPRMRELLRLADQLAQVDAAVLVTGETGVGKEVVAQYLHRHSRRAGGKLVEIDCAALPENLLEAELFGYEKGAFTGALGSGKPGLVERAQGGTLFLDEVNSLPLALQGKLLRVLEARRSKRLGALEERDLDFRLVCASNQDLKALSDQGLFRSDLYYRIDVVPLHIPPLRERREDIIPLALHFLGRFCKQYGLTKVFERSVLDSLLGYDWPGNVRELKNVVERLVITSTAGTIQIRQMPEQFLSGALSDAEPGPPAMPYPSTMPDWEALYREDPKHFTLKAYLERCEKAAIAGALARCGTTYKAAELLGTNQSTVARKKQKYRL